MRVYTVLIILLVCGAAAAGCTGTQPVQQAASPTAPSLANQVPTTPVPSGVTANVMIRDRAFDPEIITIDPGTTVIWTNNDPTTHRVVHLPGPNSPELFHSAPLSTGQTFSYTFGKSGSYIYGDPQMGGGRSPKVVVR